MRDTLQTYPIPNDDNPMGAWGITNHGDKIGEAWHDGTTWNAVNASDIPIPIPAYFTNLDQVAEYVWLVTYYGAGTGA